MASGPLGQEYCSIHAVRDTKSRGLNALLHRYPTVKSGLIEFDLTFFAKVRTAACIANERVAKGSLPPIRAVILNAGFQESSMLKMSKGGFEMAFQVNFLSHFLFVLSLLQIMDREHGRILLLSSPAHN